MFVQAFNRKLDEWRQAAQAGNTNGDSDEGSSDDASQSDKSPSISGEYSRLPATYMLLFRCFHHYTYTSIASVLW